MRHTKERIPDTIPVTVSAYGQRVMDLKEEGHRLIKSIGFYGIDQNEVYKRLAKLLNVPTRQAHFSEMHSERHLARAIAALQVIQSEYHHKLVTQPRLKELAKKNRERQRDINEAGKAALPPVFQNPAPKMNVGRKGETADGATVKAAFDELKRRNEIRAKRRRRYWFLAWLF